MRTATTSLQTNLQNNQQFFIADLYTFLLAPNDRLFFWSNTDYNVTANGSTFSASGPRFNRSKVSTTLGIQVSTFQIDVISDSNDILYDGLSFLQLVARGDFDNAEVQVDRAFMINKGVTTDGTIRLFNGTIGETQNLTRTGCSFECNSITNLLNAQLPKNLIQAACRWTLFDTSCALAKETFAVAGTTLTGSAASLITSSTSFTNPTGWYDLGTMTYTSGANNGLHRTIKTYTNPNSFEMVTAFPYIPAGGDTFKIYPGCDKTLATCTNKFNNAPRFGGEPFVPAPETAL